jgi:hypothetical protein
MVTRGLRPVNRARGLESGRDRGPIPSQPQAARRGSRGPRRVPARSAFRARPTPRPDAGGPAAGRRGIRSGTEAIRSRSESRPRVAAPRTRRWRGRPEVDTPRPPASDAAECGAPTATATAPSERRRAPTPRSPGALLRSPPRPAYRATAPGRCEHRPPPDGFLRLAPAAPSARAATSRPRSRRAPALPRPPARSRHATAVVSTTHCRRPPSAVTGKSSPRRSRDRATRDDRPPPRLRIRAAPRRRAPPHSRPGHATKSRPRLAPATRPDRGARAELRGRSSTPARSPRRDRDDAPPRADLGRPGSPPRSARRPPGRHAAAPDRSAGRPPSRAASGPHESSPRLLARSGAIRRPRPTRVPRWGAPPRHKSLEPSGENRCEEANSEIFPPGVTAPG